MSNDDENKRPSTSKNRLNNNESSTPKEKKSSNMTNQVHYRILQRGEPDEPTSTVKKSQKDLNTPENSTTSKSQRNRRKFNNQKYNLIICICLLYRTCRSTFK